MNLKSVSICLIPYMLFCSGIYHMSFWNTFSFNGLDHIDVSDLIKSFLYPFLALSFSFLISMISGWLFFGSKQILPLGEGAETKAGKILNSKPGVLISILLLILFMYLSFNKISTISWLLYSSLISNVFGIYLFNKSFLKKTITDNLFRYRVIIILVLMPILSFALGKFNSIIIYHNKQYFYTIHKSVVINNKYINDTLKLIGKTSKSYIFSDLNNLKIYILQSENIDTLTLHKYGIK